MTAYKLNGVTLALKKLNTAVFHVFPPSLVFAMYLIGSVVLLLLYKTAPLLASIKAILIIRLVATTVL